MNMPVVKNPILPGFHPDPSICQGEDAYYLVNSTFAYAPGVPLYRSEDLSQWEQIGHILARQSQLPLDGARVSEGIYAPCIRYHEGTYYMITTNVSDKGNFYVTAETPFGPWSEPNYLEEAEGIDPSLYFEGEKCYYIGQRGKANEKFWGDCEVWIQELDLKEKKLIGEPIALWDGALKESKWVEGPHLYKKDEYYYILIAEGGTEYGHSICIARSKSLFGPYEGSPYNPLFTHRHLGRSYPVQSIGHGDLVETPDGDWYMVMLGTRPIDGCGPLGRETFIADVVWEEGWPVVNAGEGKIRTWQPIKKTAKHEKDERITPQDAIHITWNKPLDQRLLMLRQFDTSIFQMNHEKVTLKMLPQNLSDLEVPAYIATRLYENRFTAQVSVVATPKEQEEAGLVYFYNEKNYLRFVIHARASKSISAGKAASIYLVQDGEEKKLRTISIEGDCHVLRMEASGLKISCFIDLREVDFNIDVSGLCPEEAGGFIGCTVGIFATANHNESSNSAEFGPLDVNVRTEGIY